MRNETSRGRRTATRQRAESRWGTTFAEFHARLGGVPLDRLLMKPPPGTATEADLLAAWQTPPHHRCELVDGALIEKFGSLWGAIAVGVLCHRLGTWADETDAGVALMGNFPYRLASGLIRLPSFSFTPWERFPNEELPDEEVGSFVPTLVVELPNTTNTAAEIDRKVTEYFEWGVRLVWVVSMTAQTAKVYTSPKRFKELDAKGTLDGGKVLPGFKLPLPDLFAATRPRKKKPR
jgi:hypothetical protein